MKILADDFSNWHKKVCPRLSDEEALALYPGMEIINLAKVFYENKNLQNKGEIE